MHKRVSQDDRRETNARVAGRKAALPHTVGLLLITNPACILRNKHAVHELGVVRVYTVCRTW